MNRIIRHLVGALLLGAVLGTAAAAAGDSVRQLEWDDLMPKDWNPFARLEALRESGRLDALEDGTAEADAVMREFVTAGRSAPVVPELDGARVRIPGFVVPLDFEGTEVNEFLLVPYFGACIHVPPPPANQIVYVKSPQAYPLDKIYDPIWVSGTLRTEAFLNDLGDAGYTLQAELLEPYTERP